MDTSARIVIVLIPGAWHTPGHYKHFTTLLEGRGYEVVAQTNPSCGSQAPHEQDVATDVAAIRNTLLPLVEAGRDVVLAMHSYGGSPGAAAAVGLSKTERLEQGKSGGIIGLAFITAFVANEGDSLKSKLPGQQWEPWHIILDDGQVLPDRPMDIFYADVPSPALEQAINALQVQARASFTTPSPPPAWPLAAYNGRRSYLQCTEDQAIPLIAQQMMVQHSGVGWNVSQIESSHSPFLSKPQETASWLDEQIKMFIAAA